MPKSKGRPLNRRRKTPKPESKMPLCACGGKATKFGKCIRCLDAPLTSLALQAYGVYLPSRAERRAACLTNILQSERTLYD